MPSNLSLDKKTLEPEKLTFNKKTNGKPEKNMKKWIDCCKKEQSNTNISIFNTNRLNKHYRLEITNKYKITPLLKMNH